MAKASILKLLFRLCILPLVVLSKLAYLVNWRGFRRDVRSVVSVVDETAAQVPEKFAALLFIAEDHRAELHAGVDPIALMRAAWVWLRWRRREGGSTVEQQLVRTVLCMYEHRLSRKLREQLLAVAVSRRRTKRSIATAYLAVAYYGTRCTGVSGLKKLCGNNLGKANSKAICGAVARLKYPEPRQPSARWSAKYHHRVEYIVQRQVRLTNHSSGRPYRAAAEF
jgi:penicillin-binding protein 1A